MKRLRNAICAVLLLSAPAIADVTASEWTAAPDGLLENKGPWFYAADTFHDSDIACQRDISADFQPVSKLFNPPGWRRGDAFSVRLELPEISAIQDPVLYIRGVDEYFTVCDDSRVLYRWGDPAQSFSSFEWHMISLKQNQNKTVFLHIGSSMATAGIVDNRIIVGERSSVVSRIIREDIDKMVLGFLYIILGVAAFVFLITGVNRPAFFNFGFFSLTLGMYTLSRTAVKQLVFGHNHFAWGWIELFSLYLMPIGIGFLVRSILRPTKKNPVYWTGYVALAWAFGVGLVSVFHPRFLIDTLLVFQIMLLLYVLVLIGSALVSALRGNHDARVFSLGVGVLALFGLYDVLREWRLFEDYGFLSHWGLLIFVGMLLYILIRRIVHDHKALQHYSRQLEDKNTQIEQSHKELEKLYAEIDLTQKEVIFRLSEIAEVRSKETGNHVRRVAEYSRILAKACGLDDELVRLLRLAAPMHDVGKLGVPDAILHKPGKLTPEEFDVIKGHTRIGFEMLYKSPREVFTAAAIVAYEHHEKYDGSGYPCGKAGDEIHIFGRITAVADVFDSLISDRCYKKAWELPQVLELFEKERGRHFDPVVVDAFFDQLDRFMIIRDTFDDGSAEHDR